MSGIPAIREWQREGIETLVEESWKKDVDAKPLVAACPGAGKTLFAVLAAKRALTEDMVEVIVVVAPSVIIKEQWCDEFKKIGVDAHSRADNEALRTRKENREHLTGGWTVLCVTYQQLSQGLDLFLEIARRYPTMVVADEVHHADDSESFGKALNAFAESCKLRLSLSGTPFNTTGGALAMCECQTEINADGRQIIRTIPTISYGYGQALSEPTRDVCRPVEFTKVYGVGEATYRRISDATFFNKIVDLARENKTDKVGMLLDPEGGFMRTMAIEALRHLKELKEHDRLAGMLVVAKDTKHGAAIVKLLERVMHDTPGQTPYSIVQIYNDTHKAHDRIRALNTDQTDIVVTVRMISEGTDVKRLRVGLYATDYLTELFFRQFVGRFVRHENRLGGTQHARIVIPAHILLLNYVRQLEEMIDTALIPDAGVGGVAPPNPDAEFKGSSTVSKDISVEDTKGYSSADRDLAEAFFTRYPSLRGVLSELEAIKAAQEGNMDGATVGRRPEPEENWSVKNDHLVRQVVRAINGNGASDGSLYAHVNDCANKHVGIKKKDALTKPDVLERRYQYLCRWVSALLKGEVFNG